MSDTIKLPCPVGEVSDGYHTFNELYEHRHALMLALMSQLPDKSWFSSKHDDGTEMKGWFIAGIVLPSGTITYHMPNRLLQSAACTGAKKMAKGLKWDGHPPDHVISRLKTFSNRKPAKA